jgi:hypothetical protein
MDDVRLEVLDYVVDAEAEGEGEAQRGVERELHTAKSPKDVKFSTCRRTPARRSQPWGPTAVAADMEGGRHLVIVCEIGPPFSGRLIRA